MRAFITFCLVLAGAFAYSFLPVQAGQAPAADNRPHFDAVSIKPTANGRGGGGGAARPGGKMIGTNQSLKQLMSVAYSVSTYQIFGDPNLLEGQGYTTDASAGRPADTPELRVMLQTALEDIFKLKYHHEKRDLPAYFLSVAKPGVRGPRLTQDPNGDCAQATSPQAPTEANRAAGATGPCGNVNLNPAGSIKGYRGRIAQLVDRLSTVLARPVVDKTGLDGLFDISLTWTPDPTSGVPANPSIDPNGPSLFTAIQEQLGLKLESGKAPIDVIVVDYAEKPTGK